MVLKTLFILAIFFPSIMAFTQQFTTCNCENPTPLGILDIEEPERCGDGSPPPQSKLLKYEVFHRIQPNTTGIGYMCMKWEHSKIVTGYFFNNYDTVFTKREISVSRRECWDMIETGKCSNGVESHTMQPLGKSFVFNAQPTGEGHYCQTTVYTKVNCLAEILTMRQDCPTCPIFSNLGKATDDGSHVSATHGSAIIVWKPISVFFSPEVSKCMLNKSLESKARITKSAKDGSIRVIDDERQLDLLIDNDTITCDDKIYSPFRGISNLYSTHLK